MKTSWLVGIVLTVHCVALGCILMMQGCGTTKGPGSKVTEPRAAKTEGKEKGPGLLPPAPGTTSAAPLSVKTTTYVVARGDTLSHIAQKFKLSVAEIKALNNITDPSKLKEGQKLVLPGEMDASIPPVSKKATTLAPKPKVEAAKPTVAPVAIGGNVYTVKTGDALSKIAKAYATSVESIRQANGLKGDAIRVGQKLTIPASSAAKEPASSPEASANVQGKVPAALAAFSSTEVKGTGESARPLSAASDAAAQKVAPPPASTETTQTHTVQPGEDLDSVAMTWAVSVAEIKKLNGLTNDAIEPGQRLKIPLTE